MRKSLLNRKTSFLLGVAILVVANFCLASHQAKAHKAVYIKKQINKMASQLDKEEQNKVLLNTNLQVTQVIINSTASKISATKREINKQEKKLKDLTNRIAFNKKILVSYCQKMYFNDQEASWILDFGQQDFNQYFQNFDQLINTKKKVLAIMEEIKKDKEETEKVKEDLAQKKEDHRRLLVTKQKEKNGIVTNINKAKATIAELQKKLAEMRSDLAKLTGESFTTEDIRKAVEFASAHTRVPKGVLYGFLGAETHFNANTGQCTYDDVKSDAMNNYKKLLKISKKWQSSIDKLDERKDIFKDIVKKLGYSKKKKVSCTPKCNLKISGKKWDCIGHGYIGQGGAMGVAQFMPDVWKYRYESKIKAKTGHNNPDPWNIVDGIMAMALKLESAGATSDKSSVIKKASVNYLGYFYQPYYNDIIYWSKNYKTIFK